MGPSGTSQGKTGTLKMIAQISEDSDEFIVESDSDAQ
jgi:hypothetical protein